MAKSSSSEPFLSLPAKHGGLKIVKGQGKVVSYWPNHSAEFGSMEELRAAGVLNLFELGELDKKLEGEK